jgi:hypothetical protein
MENEKITSMRKERKEEKKLLRSTGAFHFATVNSQFSSGGTEEENF